ncbi:hypothetical protein SDC9_62178 [bioreactor metagenome]|uniref:Uncharacterized protein n=1 Tax=bioreactor metagenome TaxID=1076179 RepID=A0A644XHW7_9ZZZZ
MLLYDFFKKYTGLSGSTQLFYGKGGHCDRLFCVFISWKVNNSKNHRKIGVAFKICITFNSGVGHEKD